MKLDRRLQVPMIGRLSTRNNLGQKRAKLCLVALEPHPMKRTSQRLRLILALVFMACASVANSQNNPLFADPNLEKAVRDELNKPTGDLTRADLDRLTVLRAPNYRIKTLAGLEAATNLFVLDVTQNDITDATAVAALPQLTYLNLSWNYVRDFSLLRSLTNLTSLFLDANSLETVPQIAHMTRLVQLGLSRNNISVVDPLLSLTNLQFLSLDSNPIESLTPLCGLTNLNQLDLGNLSLTNADCLACFTNATSLSLFGNKLRDLNPLLSLTKLQSIDLSRNPVNDWTPLGRLTNLMNLTIYDGSLQNIEWIRVLRNIGGLGLNHNSISDLSPLAVLTNLAFLDISDNPVTNYSPLAVLPRLEVLYTEGNSITDLTCVAGLRGLGRLSVMRNRIGDLASVTALTNLVSLEAGMNLLTNISALPELPRLQYVYLHQNLLDLTPGTEAVAVIQALETQGVSVYYEPQIEPPQILVRPNWLVPAGQKSWLEVLVTDGGTFWLEPAVLIASSSDPIIVPETRLGMGFDSGYSVEWFLGVNPPVGQSGTVMIALSATNAAGLWTNSSVQVEIAPTTPFSGEYLDSPSLTWSTGGEPAWFGQNLESHDGFSSAQSGATNSWLQTKVTGPGSLRFWYRLESNYYYANGQLTATAQDSNLQGYEHLHRRGEMWQEHIVGLPVGEWLVKWSPSWDSWGFGGWNTLWVDQVTFEPGPPACWLESWPYELPNGELEFYLHGALGQMYQVEVSTDLRNWSPLTLVTCRNFETIFRDRKPAAGRFYRAKAVP
jgi:hypothetical protein